MMFISKASLAFYALSSSRVLALPAYVASPYAVKERHVVPEGWTQTGPASKSQLINLQIGLKQGSEGLVEKHLLETSDPSHSRFRQHLTADEVNDLIRPSTETIEEVHAWLLEHEISDVNFSPAQDWVTVVIPTWKAEELLQTEYSIFEHEDGETYSRAPEWSLPLHLHKYIDVVQPTNSFFRPVRNARGTVRAGEFSEEWWSKVGKPFEDSTDSLSKICNISLTTPKCIRTLYGTIDYTPKATDKNAIGCNNYLNETNKRSDISKFLKMFRPEIASAANEFKIVTIADAPNDQGPYTKQQVKAEHNIEGNLDSELILSISYPTPFTAFSTGGSPPYKPNAANPVNDNEPYLVWLTYALAQKTLPQTISSSYGDVENTVPLSYATRVCSMFAQLGARGHTLFVSSGDSGVGGAKDTCKVHGKYQFTPAFPTGCPWVTSVGATQGFSPEVAVQRFASGAGFSNYFGQPSYQSATVDAYIKSLDGNYTGLYNKSGRAYPDVAAQGDADAEVWDNRLIAVGGTSASSPTFAAVISLVNDALIAAGKAPLGFINPWLYSGAHSALNDILSGSSYGCGTNGFPAAKGWDAVTGWGTPNFKKLVAYAMKNDPGM